MKKNQQQDPVGELELIFEEAPQIKYGDSIATWREVKPVPLSQWIAEDKIQFDMDLKIVLEKEMNEKGVYTGQVNEKG